MILPGRVDNQKLSSWEAEIRGFLSPGKKSPPTIDFLPYPLQNLADLPNMMNIQIKSIVQLRPQSLKRNFNHHQNF